MVSVTVTTKGKPTVNLDFSAKHPNSVTIAQVKSAINTKFPKVSIPSTKRMPALTDHQFVANRQRLTFPDKLDARGKAVALTEDDKTLGDYGVGEKSTLRLKDLGAQTSYRNLYLWEYVG